MMTKLNKWVIKHPSLAFNILCVLESLAIIGTYFLFHGWIIVYIAVSIVLFLLNDKFVKSRVNVEIDKAFFLRREKCDPYHLYDISTYLVDNKILGWNLHVQMIMNKCVALNGMGKYEEALEILKSITDKDLNAVTDLAKATYCNNMMSTYIYLNDTRNAELWLANTGVAFNNLRSSKKLKLENALKMNTAEIHLLKGEYDRVGEIIGDIKPQHLASDLEFRLLRAKLNIHRKNLYIAKSDLEYVISKGNKLYIVEKAKNLLAEIEQ
jgi:hypothetical protein